MVLRDGYPGRRVFVSFCCDKTESFIFIPSSRIINKVLQSLNTRNHRARLQHEFWHKMQDNKTLQRYLLFSTFLRLSTNVCTVQAKLL